MKQKRRIKLLTKTTSIYLVFTFAAFYFSAQFLINETDEYINKELDRRYKWTEGRIISDIKKHGEVKRKRSYAVVSSIEKMPNPSTFPIYNDSLIQNEERENKLLYRKKTTFIDVNDRFFKVEMIHNISDFNRLQSDILGSLIPGFIILAIVIVLFNYFLSGYFFNPFNKILNQMRNYKVGEGSNVPNIATSTAEFSKMQQLFHNMVERTEREYTTLKEYTENMAHEIQTPLMVIRNKTDNLISDETVMNTQSSSVRIIYNEVNHLSKLGNALNLLTKVEHGEFNNKTVLRTKELIIKHIDSVTELADLKGLTFELNLSDTHRINIDPILFDIILNNLVKNGLNYATKEGPIKIRTDEKSLTITNYGPPLEFPIEKIFSRFSKENGTISSLGLGLALVNKICQRNNLRIDYLYQQQQHYFIISKNPQ